MSLTNRILISHRCESGNCLGSVEAAWFTYRQLLTSQEDAASNLFNLAWTRQSDQRATFLTVIQP